MSIDNNNSSTSAPRPTCHFSNKYEKWYWSIVHRAICRSLTGLSVYSGQVEDHHVIPESMYPPNWENFDRFWVIHLTPREHYMVHLLLAKMELTPYIARAVTRFLNNKKHPHLMEQYTKLRWLGKQIVSKHGYNVPPWRNNATSTSRSAKDLWRKADLIYDIWVTHKCGGVKLSALLGDRRSTSYHSMITCFKSGWIPGKDLDWINFKNGR